MSNGRASILSLACEAPALQLSQATLLDHAMSIDRPPTDEAARRMKMLYGRTGVESRGLAAAQGAQQAADALAAITSTSSSRGTTTAERMQAYGPRAFALAHSACTRALAALGLPASVNAATHRTLARTQLSRSDITHFVSATCTGFGSPGWEALVPAALALAPTVHRTHIGFMGCHAAINALRIAQAIASNDAGAVVLVCCTEVCSLHYQSACHDAARTDQTIANALFADGAAACIVAQASDASSDKTQRNSRHVVGEIAASASMLFSDASDHMSWHIGDHGFTMTLSPQLPNIIEHRAGPWLVDWLAGQGLSLSDIKGWAVHPGGPSILSACERALCLQATGLVASRAVLAKHGNMSSPTVLFVLDMLRRLDSECPTVLLSFGPGIAAEAMLLR